MRKLLAAAIVFVLPVGGHSLNAAPLPWGPCHFERGAAMVAACTQAIETGKLDPADLAYAHGKRADHYFESSDYDRAVADYTAAIKANPKNNNYYHGRGRAYVAKGMQAQAIADFTRSIQLYPKWSWSYSARGEVHAAMRDYTRAIADFAQAIQLDTTSPWLPPYVHRGSAYEAKGDKVRARADYEVALKIPVGSGEFPLRQRASERLAALKGEAAPQSSQQASASNFDDDRKACQDATIAPRNAIAACTRVIASGRLNASDLASSYHWRMGHNLRHGDADQAIADLDQAIQTYRTAPETSYIKDSILSIYFSNRASIRFERKRDFDRALADYDEAIQLGGSSMSYYLRGIIHAEKNDDRRAMADFSKAIELTPTKYSFYYVRRGVLYQKQGDLERAADDFRTAAALPEQPGGIL